MSNTILTTLSAERLRDHYASGFWRDETIYQAARRHAERSPDAFAMRDRRRRVTFANLVAAADALAADLDRAGVRPGQRVGVWMPSRVETAVALLACSRNAYVCCPSLHRDHTVADVLGLMEHVSAAAFIGETGYGTDSKDTDIFAAFTGRDFVRHLIRVEPVDDTEEGTGLLAATASIPVPPPSADANRVVYIAFTSGTTGAPKGVMHSDNTLLANARAIAADWSFGPASTLYTMSPLSHNLGFGALVSALAVGAELVVHDLARGASVLGRIVETGATFLFGVPTHAIDLLAELRSRGVTKLGALRGFRISGAPAPPAVVAELMRRGVKPQSGYGMTEGCSHHYTLPDDDARRIVDTSGRACPGYEVKIWSSEDPVREVPTGEIGEIGGRGASLMLGYFGDQAATEAAFNADGWFMTGDLGKLDADGYLVVTGRKKDLIIRGGHNIYPARIENLAMQHDAVSRAAAFPVADARLGEKVCLAVTLRPGRSASAAELLAHLDASGLSRYDMPEYFVECEIPVGPNGKVLKRELVERARSGNLEVASVCWRPKVEESP